jgi:hypothetical protein
MPRRPHCWHGGRAVGKTHRTFRRRHAAQLRVPNRMGLARGLASSWSDMAVLGAGVGAGAGAGAGALCLGCSGLALGLAWEELKCAKGREGTFMRWRARTSSGQLEPVRRPSSDESGAQWLHLAWAPAAARHGSDDRRTTLRTPPVLLHMFPSELGQFRTRLESRHLTCLGTNGRFPKPR